MNIASKTTEQKLEALFATVEQEMKQELERLPIALELLVEELSAPGMAPLNMDAAYNAALVAAGGIAYASDARMVLDFITRNV